ncbi:hypothetical protein Pmani_024852 [Petrolisthes manimaculis]|uniref:Major facilitator superfamily (MFS) profile domain-containing protein n=1 Tax=Petrolisthes manimaculis TaxID=1843537 RepID=A0AAE1TYA9_9EUCA|nr:hypothetical protein Pmani_024852 [Petrolisthes manimaculis]
MDELKQSLKEAENVKVTVHDLARPYILKPLFIILALMDSGTDISEDMSTIIVGTVQVLATAASTLLLDRLGRKFLLCLSAGVMALSICCLGVVFYIKYESEDNELSASLGWLPLTSLIIFISAFSIGYGPIPWIMMGELFYPGVKEMAGSFATTLNWTFVFIITFTFEPLQSAIHDFGVYWLFGGLCLLSFIFCLLLVPETKDRTLKDTMAHFGGPTS